MITIDRLNEILGIFRTKKVLVIGDAMLDRYLFGQVNRISPEAPVPVLELERVENKPGGAANVAMNLHSLGASTFLISIVGNDKDGEQLTSLCREKGINIDFIVESDQRPTTVKSRVMADQQQVIRIDEEDTKPLTSEESVNFIKTLTQLLTDVPFDVVVIQDYNKGLLTSEIIKAIISQAEKLHLPVIVDPKRENFSQYKGVEIIKPNLKEAKEQVPFDFDLNINGLKKVTSYLLSETGANSIVITLGKNGIFIDDHNDPLLSPTHKKSIVDVCGAGDAVLSMLAVCMTSEVSKEETAELCNLAGATACNEVGVTVLKESSLNTELSHSI